MPSGANGGIMLEDSVRQTSHAEAKPGLVSLGPRTATSVRSLRGTLDLSPVEAALGSGHAAPARHRDDAAHAQAQAAAVLARHGPAAPQITRRGNPCGCPGGRPRGAPLRGRRFNPTQSVYVSRSQITIT